MNTNYFSAACMFLLTSCLSAQTNAINLTLSSDFENAYLNEAKAINITNSQTVDLSGTILSQNAIRIFPVPGHTIVIKPKDGSTYRAEENGTVIKSKSGGTGLPYGSFFTIYPNPVHETLYLASETANITGYAVYDMGGLLKMSQYNLNTNNYAVDVIPLTNGNYIIQVFLQNLGYSSTQFLKN